MDVSFYVDTLTKYANSYSVKLVFFCNDPEFSKQAIPVL